MGATVTATSLDSGSARMATSGADGAYTIRNIPAGPYSVTAQKSGLSRLHGFLHQRWPRTRRWKWPTSPWSPLPGAPITNVAPGNFWKRFAKAYADDWHDRTPAGPDAPYRGYPAPESNPPWPFTVWPYGGSPVIGQPNTMLPPLMTALYNGPHGEAWQKSKIQIYGWLDPGFNISSSNKPGFANAPAAYVVKSNSVPAGSGGCLRRARIARYRADRPTSTGVSASPASTARITGLPRQKAFSAISCWARTRPKVSTRSWHTSTFISRRSPKA